jgi:thiol-disulfide isomerase/thioredoxin
MGSKKSSVKCMTSLDQIKQAIATGKPTVLCLACPKWCGPCMNFVPIYAKLSNEITTVQFLTVDCDDVKNAANSYGVTAFPTFKVILNGVVKETIVGGGNYAETKLRAALHSLETSASYIPQICLPDKTQDLTQQAHLVPVGSDELQTVTMHFTSNIGNAYSNMRFIVTNVQKVVNHKLTQRFQAKLAQWQHSGKYSWQQMQPVKAFHCTHPSNISSIASNNVSMAKKGKTDAGYFGSGLYFSGFPDYTFKYNANGKGFDNWSIGDKGVTIMFDVLLGKPCKLSGLALGADKTPGYDSHESPLGYEWVLFDPDQCLPLYVVHFESRPSILQVFGTNGRTEETGILSYY